MSLQTKTNLCIKLRYFLARLFRSTLMKLTVVEDFIKKPRVANKRHSSFTRLQLWRCNLQLVIERSRAEYLIII